MNDEWFESCLGCLATAFVLWITGSIVVFFFKLL
jgi:hypothetical protein